MNLSEKIKSKGLKISWIADRLGISQPMLSMMLRGQRDISEERLKQLKEILK